MTRFPVLCPAVLLAGAAPALCQEADPPREFGGPDSVRRTETRLEGDERRFDLESQAPFLGGYFDFKRALKEQHGVTFSVSAHLLFQEADETLSGRTAGAGSIFRFQGTWSAFARGTGHEGRLNWRLEERRAIGGTQAPFDLGVDAGATALNPANGYGDDFSAGFSILSWTQLFNDSRGGVAVGRMAYDVYQDLLFVQGFSGGFLNRGIFLNPTIGTTGVGALGGVAQSMIGDHAWIGGMASDANARSAEFDLGTIREGEFLKSVELGWTSGIDRFETDRAHVTFWEKDGREEAGASRGAGWVFSGSYEFTDGFLPFLRFGASNGGGGVAAERSAAAGFQLEVDEDRIWSLGGMWARPSDETFGEDLRDEYAIETSFQLILSPNVSLMPDVQLLIHPAGAPEEDLVWVAGARALLSL